MRNFAAISIILLWPLLQIVAVEKEENSVRTIYVRNGEKIEPPDLLQTYMKLNMLYRRSSRDYAEKALLSFLDSIKDRKEDDSYEYVRNEALMRLSILAIEKDDLESASRYLNQYKFEEDKHVLEGFTDLDENEIKLYIWGVMVAHQGDRIPVERLNELLQYVKNRDIEPVAGGDATR